MIAVDGFAHIPTRGRSGRALVAIGALLGLASCGRGEPRPVVARAAPVAPAAGQGAPDAGVDAEAPGLRLPEGAAPLTYDVRLELDPDRESFAGRVEIRVRLAAPAERVWLHAADLEIAGARFRAGERGGALEVGAERGELRALGFGQRLPAGEVALELAYTGRVADGDAEGLFRQRAGGRWYLFSQAESVFARRIVPCFDEPRFKATWRVTIVAPDGQVALANAPLAAEARLGDGRRELRFAELGPSPSYLVAVAVGPFALVDAGRVGRGRVPVRAAVAPVDARRTAAIARWAPRLVDALERYLDLPLPAVKLDLVAVPRFFGAMENPGLVTFQAHALAGDPDDPVYLRRFVRILAHELAHQWFGNAVTPAWWDDLWLAEAFATWLDDKLSAELGALDDAPLRTQLARAHALEADRAPDARPLRRAIASAEEAEDAFDAISYEKGAAVLAMFERFVGEARFQGAVRAFVRARAGGTATAADFVAALGAASDPAVARAFAAYLDHPGAPIVDLELACGAGRPAVAATPRGGATVPVCVRYPGRIGPATACALAAAGTAIPLAEAVACPAWIAGNADGRGYYHVGRAPPGPPGSPIAERLAAGFDRAAAVARGELGAAAAVSEIRTLLAAGDPYAAVAAMAIAAEIDQIAEDAVRPAWSAWLAARLGPRLGRGPILAPRAPVELALREAIVAVVPGPRFERAAVQAAAAAVDGALAAGGRSRIGELAVAVALAAPAGGGALFDRLVAAAAAAADDPARRDVLLEAAGTFGPELASRAVALALDGRFPPDAAVAGVAAMLARPETRGAAWRAVRERLPELVPRLAVGGAKDLLEATGSLCDTAARAELARVVEPHLAGLGDGRRLLDRALAKIDACLARRAALGDLAAALP